MRDIKLTEAIASADEEDVLIVRGTVNGRPVQARGYVSDTTHYYPPENGNGPVSEHGSTPREMTADEKRAYCERLLIAKCTVPVRATKTGYDNVCVREPGDVFEMPFNQAYGSSTWFVPIEQDAPKGLQ